MRHCRLQTAYATSNGLSFQNKATLAPQALLDRLALRAPSLLRPPRAAQKNFPHRLRSHRGPPLSASPPPRPKSKATRRLPASLSSANPTSLLSPKVLKHCGTAPVTLTRQAHSRAMTSALLTAETSSLRRRFPPLTSSHLFLHKAIFLHLIVTSYDSCLVTSHRARLLAWFAGMVWIRVPFRFSPHICIEHFFSFVAHYNDFQRAFSRYERLRVSRHKLHARWTEYFVR